MKRAISVLLVVLIIFSSCIICFAGYDQNNSVYKLVAHRGVGDLAPENTIPAFEKAGEMGYYGIEFDVYSTTDDVLVVSHDDDVARMTDGEGKISEKTFEEVLSLTIDSGSDIQNYDNLKIPTLDEVLDICEKYNACPYIEIKGGDEDNIDSLVNNLISRSIVEKTVIISTNKSYLSYIKSNYPDLKVWLISYFSFESDVKFCVDNSIDGISFYTNFFNEDLLNTLKSNNLTVSFWTVDSLDSLEKYSAYGCVDFTTNNLCYDENGDVTQIFTGYDSLVSTVKRLIEFAKQIIAKVKDIVLRIRNMIIA